MTKKEIEATHKKWEALSNNTGLSSGDTSVQFPIMMGSEPREHVKKRIRYDKMRTLFGDDEFFKIVDKKTYEDFLNEEFLSSRTIGLDLVAVQPISGPSPGLLYMDFKYNSNSDDSDNESDKK